MGGVKVVKQKQMSFLERSYIPEIMRGLGVSIRQFFRTAAGKNYHDQKDAWYLNEGNVTYQYPENPKPYPERYRGRHRLMVREDGNVRCVACMCCSTVCPANCIHITAAEHDDPTIEKYPTSFVIDELRCIFCGFCVEACPCDAIRMDSGVHIQPFADRNHAYFNRELLMELGTVSAATQGGEQA
jgi:NADH-quinone oxidoreductase subunit I